MTTQTKTAHTPGPWRVEEFTNQRDERAFRLYGRVDRPLGTLCGDNAVWLAEGEDVANARLIAAAPDMLEALDSILHDGREWLSDETVVKLEAAIQKTRGGQ